MVSQMVTLQSYPQNKSPLFRKDKHNALYRCFIRLRRHDYRFPKRDPSLYPICTKSLRNRRTRYPKTHLLHWSTALLFFCCILRHGRTHGFPLLSRNTGSVTAKLDGRKTVFTTAFRNVCKHSKCKVVKLPWQLPNRNCMQSKYWITFS